MSGPRSSVDWDAIEPHYRVGIRTLKELGAEFGVSSVAIHKHAKNNNWPRDLGAKVRARAEAKVNAKAVNELVNGKQKALTEKAVIEANAEMQAEIRLSHRVDIRRGRAVVQSLYDELELTCGPENAELIAELGELMREPDERGNDKRNEVYQKLMSLPGRVKSAKELGEALKNLVTMEREAYGINEVAKGESEVDSILRRINEEHRDS